MAPPDHASTARLLDDHASDDHALQLDDLQEEDEGLIVHRGQTQGLRRRKATPSRRWYTTINPCKGWRRVCVAVGLIALASVLAVHLTRVDDVRRITSWRKAHPIDELIGAANVNFAALLGEGPPRTVAQAAAAYRVRRGRHPPPGFDKWFTWAQQHESSVFEPMFDQIHEDVEPFWGAVPSEVRADAASWPLILSIRGGKVRRRRMLPEVFGSRDIQWQAMLEAIASEGLPDIDMPINTDDKAHIFAPWEKINDLMEAAARSRRLRTAEEMSQKYSSYPPPAKATFDVFDDYPSSSVWSLLQGTCHPNSTARSLSRDRDVTTPSSFPPTVGSDGYVSNWTTSKSACEVPYLRNLHGIFINSWPGSHLHWKRPGDQDRLLTRQFFPLFSSGKLAGANNDILIPPATSFGDDKSAYFSTDEMPWDNKKSVVFWRGEASGGWVDDSNWTRFHRHRLVSVCNGTQIGMAQDSSIPPAHVPGGDPPLPHNIPLSSSSAYPLGATSREGHSALPDWVSSWSDVVFTDAMSAYGRRSFDLHFYNASERVPMETMFEHKYLPDADGHGYSGRFRSLLYSNSVPLKATVWNEWSSSRLYAWKHFVPLDNTFMDLWGVADYFVGYKDKSGKVKKRGHDEEARAIAEAGREWAEKVLKQEDMLLYLWRVVLEYARAVDDRREELGYVADLL